MVSNVRITSGMDLSAKSFVINGSAGRASALPRRNSPTVSLSQPGVPVVEPVRWPEPALFPGCRPAPPVWRCVLHAGYPVFLPNRQRSVLNGKGCPAIFSSSDNRVSRRPFLRPYSASISAAFLSAFCASFCRFSACSIFQPVRLTTQPRGEIYEISISKQHPALCMQPEGIISGDFSTESVHQLCTEYACPSLDCRTDIS